MVKFFLLNSPSLFFLLPLLCFSCTWVLGSVHAPHLQPPTGLRCNCWLEKNQPWQEQHQSRSIRWDEGLLDILESCTSSKSKHIDVCPSCTSASLSHLGFSGHTLMLNAKQLQASAPWLWNKGALVLSHWEECFEPSRAIPFVPLCSCRSWGLPLRGEDMNYDGLSWHVICTTEGEALRLENQDLVASGRESWMLCFHAGSGIS